MQSSTLFGRVKDCCKEGNARPTANICLHRAASRAQPWLACVCNGYVRARTSVAQHFCGRPWLKQYLLSLYPNLNLYQLFRLYLYLNLNLYLRVRLYLNLSRPCEVDSPLAQSGCATPSAPRTYQRTKKQARQTSSSGATPFFLSTWFCSDFCATSSYCSMIRLGGSYGACAMKYIYIYTCRVHTGTSST